MANPAGRQSIGVDQSPGAGTRYPFVEPSEDILHLLGDLFVAFDDPRDEIVYPLRVAWLYGFGENPPVGTYPVFAAGFHSFGQVAWTELTGWIPTPANSHDIIILDANDMIVFDSTTAIRFTSSIWDNRLRILEWTGKYAVCRCTQHTDWTQEDINDGQTRTYAQYILPINGELQADTWYQMPKRVRSLLVDSDPIPVEHTAIVFEEGYNVALQRLPSSNVLTPLLSFAVPTTTVVPGTRKVNRINVSAVAGSGLGVFSDCASAEQVIRTINNVAGDSYQNFGYDAEGCIRVQRPIVSTSISPREFTYAALNHSPTAAAAVIQSSNDCVNCCNCTYFARTYQGLKRQWELFQNIAVVSESIRDVFSHSKARWQAQKQIREADLLRVRTMMEGDCKVAWGISICNASKCCISNVKVYLTWLQTLNGLPHVPAIPPYACIQTKIEGSGQCDGPILTTGQPLGISGQLSLVTWDYSDPQSVTTISGRHCFNDCKTAAEGSFKVQLHVAVTWQYVGLNPVTGLPCSSAVIRAEAISSLVNDIWATAGTQAPTDIYAQKEAPLTILNNIHPFASHCACVEV